MMYYPEVDSRRLFFVNIPAQDFPSDEEAIETYKKKYGSKLLAVVKDNDPEIVAVYARQDIQ